MSLGKRLKKLRENQGYTQRALAKLLCIANSTLAMYETDKREPDNATTTKLADFFGVTVDYLLGRTNEPSDTSLPIFSTKKVDYQDLIVENGIVKKTESEYGENIDKDIFLKNRLRQLRTEKNLTQEGIAKLVNIKKQDYSSYERGAIVPDKVILYRIAFHLDTTIEYLLGKTDNPTVPQKKEVPYSGESSYVYLAGSDGIHKIIPIPKEQEERFSKLVEAGMPELLDKENNKK